MLSNEIFMEDHVVCLEYSGLWICLEFSGLVLTRDAARARPGPGTEDSVTSDSDLQQSLSRCWALLPAVSSLKSYATIDLPDD